MITPQLPSTWQVTGTSETTKLDSRGQFSEGVLVHFTTSGGHEGDVFVPLAEATPDNVRAAIQARVDALDSIRALSGGGQ